MEDKPFVFTREELDEVWRLRRYIFDKVGDAMPRDDMAKLKASLRKAIADGHVSRACSD